MFIGYGLLILFAFLSLLIDLDYLQHEWFRHLWNFILLGVGILLLIRMRTRMHEGAFEKLQRECENLSIKAEEQKFTKLRDAIEQLEQRISILEGKR